MAGKKISELTPISKLTGSELVPLAQNGQNYSFTPEQVRALVEEAVNNFTGINSFQTGKFSVGNIAFTGSEEIRWNENLAENWQRGLSWVDEKTEASSVAVGGFINVSDKLSNHFYVSLNGDASTTYSLGTDTMTVPDEFNLRSKSNYRLIDITQDAIRIASSEKPAFIYTDASDIRHSRNGTLYNIWDSYNLPNPALKTDLSSYLPLTGGDLTGNLYIPSDCDGSALKGIAVHVDEEGETDYRCVLARCTLNSTVSTIVGDGLSRMILRTDDSVGENIIHYAKNASGTFVEYPVWDTRNLPNPASINKVSFTDLTDTTTNQTQEELQAILDKAMDTTNALYVDEPEDQMGGMLIPTLNMYQVNGDDVMAIIQLPPLATQNEGHVYLTYRDCNLTKTGGTITKEWVQTKGLCLTTDEYEQLVLKNVTNTFTSAQVIQTTSSNVPLLINYAASGATEVLLRMQLEGVTKGTLGYSTTNGTFIYDYATTSYVAIKSDGAYYGKESSMKKILVDGDAVKTPTAEGNEGDVLTVVGGTPTWKAPTSVLNTQQGNRALYEAAGAVYNEETGFYELNGLTDITEAQMKTIYIHTHGAQRMFYRNNVFENANTIRTNLPFRNNFSIGLDGKCRCAFTNCSILEVAHVSDSVLYVDNVAYMFEGCLKLKKVIGILNIRNITNISGSGIVRMFLSCALLEDIQIKNLKISISFGNSPLISLESLQYLISNASNLSAITVTVHADVYAKINDETNTDWHALLALAQEKQITFATA